MKFYQKEVTEVEDNQATIRNTFTKPTDTMEVTVEKHWEDNNNVNGKRPTGIKLQVKIGDEVVREQIVDKTNAKVETDGMTKDENIWVYTFDGLPKYNDNGEEIEYTADEEEIKVNDLMFYEKEVNGLIVTNTFQVPDERIDVKVNKVWVDNDIQEARRPESVVKSKQSMGR